MSGWEDLTEKARAVKEFTPLVVDEDDEPMKFFNVVYLPSKSICWRYLLCQWHATEFAALNWTAGGEGFLFGFHTYEEFCQVCDAFGREAKHVNPMNQTPHLAFRLRKDGFSRRVSD